MDPVRHTFPKKERLCGRSDISRLLAKGRFSDVQGGVIRFCRLSDTGSGLNRIMVSVPKKLFKRAVARNLMKRRIREAWRLRKGELASVGHDVLIIYICKRQVEFNEIYDSVGRMISKMNADESSRA